MSVASMDRILPPQATSLERAIVNTTPRWDALAGAAQGFDGTTPGVFKPWLAGDLGLAQFAVYFDSQEALIEQGRRWIFERGTAAGVRRVLQWLGYDAVQIEEDGFLLHLDLGRIATQAELEKVRHVVLATLPAHMKFYRVYFVEDLRPVRLDHGPALDVGLLDNDSGEWVGLDGDDIKASFGDVRTSASTQPTLQPIKPGHTEVRSAVLTYDDRALLDTWRLDSQILLDAYGGLTELFTGRTTVPPYGPPERAEAELRSATATAWDAEAPRGYGTAVHTGTTSVPIFAKRYWTGPWAGWWRQNITLKHTEET